MMGRPSPVRRGLSVLFPFDLSRVGCLWPACVCLLQGGRRKGILVSNASSSSSPLSPVSFTLSSPRHPRLPLSCTAHHLQDARKACGDSTLTQVR